MDAYFKEDWWDLFFKLFRNKNFQLDQVFLPYQFKSIKNYVMFFTES